MKNAAPCNILDIFLSFFFELFICLFIYIIFNHSSLNFNFG